MDPGRLKPNQGGAVPFASVESLPSAGGDASAPPKTAPSDKPGSLKAFPVSGYEFRPDKKTPEIGQSAARTLLWRPLINTDGQGQASIRLELPDSTAVYRVSVDAHGTTGRLGEGTLQLPCRKSP